MPQDPQFQSKFDQLRTEYKQRFGSDFEITGEDTPEHLRFYGHGNGRDVRAKTMNEEQRNFVRQRAPEIGLNLRDFSSLTGAKRTSTGVLLTGPHFHFDAGNGRRHGGGSRDDLSYLNGEADQILGNQVQGQRSHGPMDTSALDTINQQADDVLSGKTKIAPQKQQPIQQPTPQQQPPVQQPVDPGSSYGVPEIPGDEQQPELPLPKRSLESIIKSYSPAMPQTRADYKPLRGMPVQQPQANTAGTLPQLGHTDREIITDPGSVSSSVGATPEQKVKESRGRLVKSRTILDEHKNNLAEMRPRIDDYEKRYKALGEAAKSINTAKAALDELRRPVEELERKARAGEPVDRNEYQAAVDSYNQRAQQFKSMVDEYNQAAQQINRPEYEKLVNDYNSISEQARVQLEGHNREVQSLNEQIKAIPQETQSAASGQQAADGSPSPVAQRDEERQLYTGFYNAFKGGLHDDALELAEQYLARVDRGKYADEGTGQRAQWLRNYVTKRRSTPSTVIDLSDFIDGGRMPTQEDISKRVADSLGFDQQAAEEYASSHRPDLIRTQDGHANYGNVYQMFFGKSGEDQRPIEQVIADTVDRARRNPGGLVSIGGLSPGAIPEMQEWLKSYRQQRGEQRYRDIYGSNPILAEQEQTRILRDRRLNQFEKDTLRYEDPSWIVRGATDVGAGAEGVVGSALTGAGIMLGDTEIGKGLMEWGKGTSDHTRYLLNRYGGDSSVDELLQAGGSSLPFFVTGAFGRAAIAGVGLLGWLSNQGQVYEEAKRLGASEKDARNASYMGGLVGLTEMFGVSRTLGRAARHAMIKGFIQAVLREAGEEATQETVQGILNNLIANRMYDPKRALLQDVGKQALLAAIVGGGFGAIAHGGARLVGAPTEIDIEEAEMQRENFTPSLDYRSYSPEQMTGAVRSNIADSKTNNYPGGRNLLNSQPGRRMRPVESQQPTPNPQPLIPDQVAQSQPAQLSHEDEELLRISNEALRTGRDYQAPRPQQVSRPTGQLSAEDEELLRVSNEALRSGRDYQEPGQQASPIYNTQKRDNSPQVPLSDEDEELLAISNQALERGQDFQEPQRGNSRVNLLDAPQGRPAPSGVRRIMGEARQAERRADVAERERDTDPLTGVANRRALDRALPSAESDPDTSVIAFDANNFGQVNKIASQERGDELLKDLSFAITQAADEHGMAGRVFRRGGDEFVVLAPKSVAEAIQRRAEELFGEVEVSDGQGKSVKVSLSGTVGNTFNEADATLQSAKATRKAAQSAGKPQEQPGVTEPSQGIPSDDELANDILAQLNQEADHVAGLQHSGEDDALPGEPSSRVNLLHSEPMGRPQPPGSRVNLLDGQPLRRRPQAQQSAEPEVEVLNPDEFSGLTGGTSGTTNLSNEEVSRHETFYKVDRAGNLTYLGRQPDSTLKRGEAVVGVNERGEHRIVNDSGFDSRVLDRPNVRENLKSVKNGVGKEERDTAGGPTEEKADEPSHFLRYKEFATRPDATSIPKGHLLSTDLSKETRESLDRFTGEQLSALAEVLAAPTSGTKARKIENILRVFKVRSELKEATRESLMEKSGDELRRMMKDAGMGPGGTKSERAVRLLNWRNQSRRKGQESLKRAKYLATLNNAIKTGKYRDAGWSADEVKGLYDSAGSDAPAYLEENMAPVSAREQRKRPTRDNRVPASIEEVIKDAQHIASEHNQIQYGSISPDGFAARYSANRPSEGPYVVVHPDGKVERIGFEVDQPQAESPVGTRTAESPSSHPAIDETIDTGEKHKFSSSESELPAGIAQELVELGKQIPDQDLAADGREDQPHITVKYGLHSKDVEELRKALEGQGPISVKFGKTKVFEGVEDGTADAIVVEVESPDLHLLNGKISDEMEHTDTYPDYKPHATIAYVKPGLGKKYAAKLSLEGKEATLSTVTFSSKTGEKTALPLLGDPKEVESKEGQPKEPAASADSGESADSRQEPLKAASDQAIERDAIVGRESEASTERGTKVKTQLAVVPLGHLVTSFDASYPKEFQPRDRTRVSSQEQINRIANNLNPLLLRDSPLASEGAPLVAARMIDGEVRYIVISGNGRTEGLRRAPQARARDYANHVAKHAREFGLDQYRVGNQLVPIALVRIIKSDVDLAQLAEEANESSVAAMSAMELARKDGKKLTGGLMEIFHPTDDGEIVTAANREFIRRFGGEVLGPNERAAYYTADGQINQDGVKRIRNAVFARAFGDTEDGLAAVEKLAESTDNNVRNITNALLHKAGKLAALKESIEKGTRHELDLSGELAGAMRKLSALREANTTVDEYLRQGGLFGEEISPLTKRILQVFDQHKRSARAINQILEHYLRGAELAGDPKQASFFSKEKPQKEALFEAAFEEATNGKGAQADLFSQPEQVRDQGLQPEPKTDSSVSGEAEERPAAAITQPAQSVEADAADPEPITSKVKLDEKEDQVIESYAGGRIVVVKKNSALNMLGGKGAEYWLITDGSYTKTGLPMSSVSGPTTLEEARDTARKFADKLEPEKQQAPEKEDASKPKWKKGDRVVQTKTGRHGEVSEVTTLKMGSVFGGQVSYSHHYRFKSDNGSEDFASADDLELESDKPETVIPDIRHDGVWYKPEEFWRRVKQQLPGEIARLKGSKERARKRENKNRYDAEIQRKEEAIKEAYKVWDEWAAKHPDEAQEISGETEDHKELRRLKNIRYKTAAVETQIKLLERDLAANAEKWSVGDGVGWKLGVGKTGRYGSSQINRGFRIVQIFADTKEAIIRQVADTGIADTNYHATSDTGGSYLVGDTRVKLGDLLRDRKYDDAARVSAPTGKAADAVQGNGVEVRENKEKGGIELWFDGKPSAETIASVKANGFRSAKRAGRWFWYAKKNARTDAFARSLTASQDEVAPTSPDEAAPEEKPEDRSPRHKAVGVLSSAYVDRVEWAGYDFAHGKPTESEYSDAVGKMGAAYAHRMREADLTIKLRHPSSVHSSPFTLGGMQEFVVSATGDLSAVGRDRKPITYIAKRRDGKWVQFQDEEQPAPPNVIKNLETVEWHYGQARTRAKMDEQEAADSKSSIPTDDELANDILADLEKEKKRVPTEEEDREARGRVTGRYIVLPEPYPKNGKVKSWEVVKPDGKHGEWYKSQAEAEQKAKQYNSHITDAWANVPQKVRERVESALERLRNIDRRIESARGMDEELQGQGRYESDAYENNKGEIASIQKVIEDFRQFAPSNGVDAEAALKASGGVPSFEMSSDGQVWQSEMEAKRQATDDKPSRRQAKPDKKEREAAEREAAQQALVGKFVPAYAGVDKVIAVHKLEDRSGYNYSVQEVQEGGKLGEVRHHGSYGLNQRPVGYDTFEEAHAMYLLPERARERKEKEIIDSRRAATEEKVSGIKGKRAELLKQLREHADKEKNKRHSGPEVDLEGLKIMVNLVRTYIDEGIVRFSEAARYFLEDFGEDAHRYGRAFEIGWEKLKKHHTEIDEAGKWDEAVATESADEEDAGSSGEAADESDRNTKTRALVDAIKAKVARGERFKTNLELDRLAEEKLGGSLAAGDFSSKDVYDAMEVAVNELVAGEMGARLLDGDAKEALAELRDLMKLIPRQATRTEEMDRLQQFSTPPTLAFVAAKVANITSDDIMLEPSAGTGSLASWARAAGAEVHTNEVSERRREMLEMQGYTPTGVDAQYLNSTLPERIKPTVILMNPPFSSTATGARNDPRNGFMHVEHALSRLQDGGRLVGILSESAAIGRERMDPIWQKIAKRYNVRAVVSLPGDEYARYGTSYDNVLIVIDKTGPTPGANWGEQVDSIRRHTAKSYEDALDAVSEIAADRQPVRAALPPTRPTGEPVQGGAGAGGRGAVKPVRSNGGNGGRSSQPPTGVRPGTDGGNGNGAGKPQPSPTATESRTDDAARGAAPSDRSGADERTDLNSKPVDESGVAFNQNEIQKRESEDGGTFVQYKPAKLKGGVAHKANIVESASMAAVDPPDISYKPILDSDVIKSGHISDLQLEAISYAGQRHEQVLSTGERAGFFLGDGTGVGKGRTIGGVILDNRARGRKRAIWVSFNNDLLSAAKDDLAQIGGKDVKLAQLNKWKAEEGIDLADGVIFLTYSTLPRSKAGDPSKSRLNQLQEWLGEDGVIIFDEAHKAKGALGDGRGQPTDAGKAVIDLQNNLKGARIVYSSATGATEVRHMAYATRLGLWGPGTSFPDGFVGFLNEINNGGVGAMEMIARDMKALGMYVARTLSYKGVEYDEVIAKLTPDQEAVYDVGAQAWQKVQQNIHTAIATINGGKQARNAAFNQFWSAHQRFFNQFITALKVPELLRVIERELDGEYDVHDSETGELKGREKGQSIIISLINTGESRTKSQVARAASDGLDLEDLDFSPREIIAHYVDAAFPTIQYVDKPDPSDPTKVLKVPLLDGDGHVVHNPDALRMKEQLLDSLSSLNFPENPLDQIVNHFGADQVAEMTRRGKRLIRDPHTGKVEYVARNPEGVSAKDINGWERDQFMEGNKRIAIISDAASTGISLHSSNRAKNRQRRVQIALQLNWSADKQMQTFGRSHRTDQHTPPKYILMSSNVGGEKRFSSSIARRMESLGALTRGQRDASGGGELAKYNFETAQGESAVMHLYQTIRGRREVPGLDDARQALIDMGILKVDALGREQIENSDLTDVKRFLNRVLALEVSRQNPMFDAFNAEFQRQIDLAKQNGSFDEGVADLPGESIRLKGEPTTVHTDPLTGSVTQHVTLEVDSKTYPVPFDVVADRVKKKDGAFFIQKNSGAVIFARQSGSRTDPKTGATYQTYRVTTPAEDQHSYIRDLELTQKYKPIHADDARATWEQKFKEVPKTTTREEHIIAGSILPLWQRLKSKQDEGLQVVRAETDEGQRVVGVRIPRSRVAAVLRSIGVTRSFTSPDKIFDAVLHQGEEVNLVTGLKLVKTKLKKEDIIELRGAATNVFNELRGMGLINERDSSFKQRFYIPADEQKGIETLTKLLERYPAMDSSGGAGEADLPDSFGAPVRLPGAGATRLDVDAIPGGTDKTLKEMQQDLESKLNHHVRTAKTPRGTQGSYNPNSTRTTVRFSGDMDSIGHEQSHWLDDEFNLVGAWSGSHQRSPFDAELMPAFSQHGVTNKRASLASMRAEGVAEWIRAWMFNPTQAEVMAPLFTAHFEATVPAHIRQAIRDFGDDVRRWRGMTPVERGDARVNYSVNKDSVLGRLRSALRFEGHGFKVTAFDRLTVAAQDSLKPVMKAIAFTKRVNGSLGPMLPSIDPEVLIRLFAGMDAKFDEIFEKGMIDFLNNHVLPGGVEWLFEPFDQTSRSALERHMRATVQFMISQRVLDEARKIQDGANARIAGLNPADPKYAQKAARIQTQANQAKARLAGTGAGLVPDDQQAMETLLQLMSDPTLYAVASEGADRYRAWADANLRYLVEKGMMSDDTYLEIKQNNEYYVGLQRVMDDLDSQLNTKPLGKRVGSVRKVIHKFKGSTREIENPYVNLLDQTYRMVREADRNEALRAFTDLIDPDRKMYHGTAIDYSAIGSKATAGDKDAIRVFVPYLTKSGLQKVRVEYWQFQEDVHKALKGWGEIEDHNLIAQALMLPARIIRGAVTHSPDFLGRNVLRDAANKAVVSETGSKPWTLPKASDLPDFRMFGGDIAGHYLASKGNYHKRIDLAIAELSGDKRNIIMRAPVNALDSWKSLCRGSELVGRLSEYKTAYKKAKNQLGYSDYDASLYAAYQSRSLIDYAIAGTAGKWINRFIPFTNPAIQGVARAFKGARKNPGGFAGRWAMYVLVPTLFEMAWHAAMGRDDEDEWRNLPAYQRDLFWNFKLGDDLWLRIPKPFELGVMASAVTRLVDAARGARRPFEGYPKQFTKAFMPFDEGAVAGPLKSLVEVWANHDFFRDKPIVPSYEAEKDLELRTGNRRASRVGLAMEKLFGFDARYGDHLLDTFGGFGRAAKTISDVGRKDRKAITLSSGLNMATGLFTSSPGYGSKDVQGALNDAKRKGKQNDVTVRTFNSLVQSYMAKDDRAGKEEAGKLMRKGAAALRDGLEGEPLWVGAMLPKPIEDSERKRVDAALADAGAKPSFVTDRVQINGVKQKVDAAEYQGYMQRVGDRAYEALGKMIDDSLTKSMPKSGRAYAYESVVARIQHIELVRLKAKLGDTDANQKAQMLNDNLDYLIYQSLNAAATRQFKKQF